MIYVLLLAVLLMAAPTDTPVKLIPPGWAFSGAVQPTTCGPFSYGTSLYAVFENSAYFDVPPMTDGFQVYKSTDRGATWAVVDPQDSAFFSVGGYGGNSWNVVQIGSKLYLVRLERHYEGSGFHSQAIYIHQFDMGADEWTANVGGGAHGSWTVTKVAYTGQGLTEGRLHSAAVVRSGEIYVFFPYEYNGSGWMKLAYSVWNPTTGWTGPTTVKDDSFRHHYPYQAVLAGDTIHVTSGSDTDNPPTADGTDSYLHHFSLSSVDVLGTYQTIATDLTPVRLPGQIAYGSDGQLCVPYYDDTPVGGYHTTLHVAFADEEANPTWSDSPIDFPDDPTDDWKWGKDEFTLHGQFYSGAIYFNGAWRVFSTTSWHPTYAAEKSRLWMHTFSGSTWTDQQMFQLFEDPNPDDGDNKSYYLLGSPQAQTVTEGIGLFFFAEDSNTPTERGSDLDQREYYFVIEVSAEVTVNFAYFGNPEAVYDSGNYGFFI